MKEDIQVQNVHCSGLGVITGADAAAVMDEFETGVSSFPRTGPWLVSSMA